MTGKEVLAQINATRTADRPFVRWWRKEEDWLDFDVIDTFIENTRDDEEIGGFELIGMEEMWEQLQKVAPGRVAKTQKGGEPLIAWQKKSGGELQCPYTPRSVVAIFDAETKGNYVD